MAKGHRQAITDLDDIYRNNQNVGAKAVRECIMSVLPRWFVEEAQDICRQTLNKGEGATLADRVAKMVTLFRDLGVTVEQLEAKTHKKRGQWDAGDVAQLGIDYTSVTRDGIDKDEMFPVRPVTMDELS